MAESGERTKPEPVWAPWAASEVAGEAWTRIHAGHLHRRAGFGADWKQLQVTEQNGPESAVERLLQPETDFDAFNRQQDAFESSGDDAPEPAILRNWWLRRMIDTPHPLLEKMTLFWHGFFGVGVERLQDTAIFLRHVRTLRKHSLGRFDELLREVLAQPAIYAANGAEKNRKGKPSLAFARRLLESWTVGLDGFSQSDVSGVARTFTGWTIRRRDLVFVEREHDLGAKTLMGIEGPLDRDEAVAILLNQPALALHIVRRLYRFFVSEEEDPGDAVLLPLAESFARDFEVSGVLATIFRSKHFYSAPVYRRCVKSPVEFAVGLLRALEGSVPGIQFGGDLAGLGQDLCQPPTSKGWFGGRAWIHPATLAGRTNLALAMLSGAGPYQGKIQLAALARRHGFETPEPGAVFLADLLLQGDVSPAVREAIKTALSRRGDGGFEERLKQAAYLIATLPEFQLS